MEGTTPVTINNDGSSGRLDDPKTGDKPKPIFHPSYLAGGPVDHSSNTCPKSSSPVTTTVSSTLATSGNQNPQMENKKLLVLHDSNGSRLNCSRFCSPIPLEDTRWGTCYTIKQLHTTLDTLRNCCFEMIVITCGTNDIDHKTGERVASELINIIKRVRKEHPQSKLVVSEATPRSRTRDDQIQACNYILHQRLQNENDVTIAEQHSLLNANWSLYEDDKHILREQINTYAVKLKSAMRKARKRMITKRTA